MMNSRFKSCLTNRMFPGASCQSPEPRPDLSDRPHSLIAWTLDHVKHLSRERDGRPWALRDLSRSQERLPVTGRQIIVTQPPRPENREALTIQWLG